MANPHQQFNFNARPQYPNAGGMNLGMNPGMNLNMNSVQNMGGMAGMANMGGMPGGQNAMSNQLLTQYQMQMRQHAGNGMAQQQATHQSTPSQQGYAGMGIPTQPQPGSGGMSLSMPPNGFNMNSMSGMGGGMANPMMGMKPQSYQQPGQQQGYPQHPQYNTPQSQYGATPHQPQYTPAQQPTYAQTPQQSYSQPGMSYPQHQPSQPSHPSAPPTPSMQHQQPSNPMYAQSGMNISQSMGYSQNGMGPGRPPSAMGTAPTMAGPGGMSGGGGMMQKPPQTPTLSNQSHNPAPGPMNPPPPPQMNNVSMNQGMQNGMPNQMNNLTPQQMMQIHQARQQQQQQQQAQQQQAQQAAAAQNQAHQSMSQQQSMGQQSMQQPQPGQMDMHSMMMQHQPGSNMPPNSNMVQGSNMSQSNSNMNMGQHGASTSIQVQVPPAGVPQNSQPGSAGPQSATRSGSVGRTPTPTLPNQMSMPPSAPTPVSSVPSSAGGMGNRPPSAAGGAMQGQGMMPPPNSVPNKMGYPMGAMPNGGMGMSINLPNMNASSMPSSQLTQLQMLGQQVGMMGVSTVGPGMFNNPTPSHPGSSLPLSQHANGAIPPPGMHNQTFNPNLGVTVGGPGAPSTSLKQMNAGLGPSPLPALGQGRLPSHAPSLAMPMPPPGGIGGTLPGPMPLTAPTPTSGSLAPSSAAGPNALARPSRSTSRGPPNAPPANPAERTMSPRQRAALIPTITRVSSVLAEDKDHPLEETLPDLTEAEIDNMAEWIGKDRKYEVEYRRMKDAMGKELLESFSAHPAPPPIPGANVQHPNGVLGKPIRWFEKDWREEGARKQSHYSLLWPSKKHADKETFFKRLGRKPVFLPKKVDPEAAAKGEMLVPIRIDADIGDGYNRLRDTFIWNANDPYVSPLVFAQTICDDFAIGFGLGQSSESARRKFLDQVVSSIQEQLADYKNHRVEIEPLPSSSTPKASLPAPAATPNKPVSTIGGSLTVNGFGREKSRSRSTTPLPGERERSEKPLSSLRKVLSSTGLGASENQSKKRSRPANEAPGGVGKVEDEEEEWWERWRKRMRVLDGAGVHRHSKKPVSKKPVRTASPRKSRPLNRKASSLPNGVPTNGIKVEVNEVDVKKALIKIEEPDEYQKELLFVDDDEPEPNNPINEDLRIMIKLDISFGIRRLEDHFEWDISDKRNSPEQFADCYCKDLGLSGEFKTAIAHSIREQVQVYEKSLFLVGHPMDGTTIQDEDLRLAFLPSLNSCIRPLDQVATYTPQLMFYNETDLEKSFDRGGPRKRRQPRGRRAGAVPLPDREPMKTFRTPMIGFPEVEKEKDTYAAPSRRQAAVVAERANAQIAVIESEQDIRTQPPFMGMIPPPGSSQTLQQQQRSNAAANAVAGTSQQKPVPELPQKKTRAELLHGPPVAKRVLRSRRAPKSTAVDPEAPLPEYLRGYDDSKPKSGGEKKKSMYRERELPEGLHPNMIDGVWHCSSCGCPEDIAIGRRQGPLGPKTMCGDCGKWWHRHRKPMDIIYRTDKEYHIERKKKEEEYRRLKKRGGMKAAQAAAAAIVDGRAAAAAQRQHAPASSSGNQSHSGHAPPLFTTVPRPISSSKGHHPPPKPLIVHSPESSLSPPPFTPQHQKVSNEKMLEPPREPSRSETSISPPASTQVAAAAAPVEPDNIPRHLLDEKTRLDGIFAYADWDIIPKPRPHGAPPAPIEWRLKCNDCPGKLYNPGPEDTLRNFEVHLKNKAHKMKVYERLGIPWPIKDSQPTVVTPAEHSAHTPTQGPPDPLIAPDPLPAADSLPAMSMSPMSITGPAPVTTQAEVVTDPWLIQNNPAESPEESSSDMESDHVDPVDAAPQVPPIIIDQAYSPPPPPPPIVSAPSPLPIKEASPAPPPAPSPSPSPAPPDGLSGLESPNDLPPTDDLPLPMALDVLPVEPLLMDEPLAIEEPVALQEPLVIPEPSTVPEPLIVEASLATEEPLVVAEPKPVEEHIAVVEPRIVEDPVAIEGESSTNQA